MTMKQVQNLLQYLGYYEGIPDGIPGPMTRSATERFQRDFGGIAVDGDPGPETQKALTHAVAYGLPERDVTDTNVGNKEETTSEDSSANGSFWDHIRYWTRDEFRCRCGEYHAPYCNGFPAEPDQDLVELLDDIRAHFGRPGHRSSGLRCPQHNRDSKGVANSKHLNGKAMDFFIEGVSGEQVRAYAAADPRCSYTYVIEGNYVHVDVD